VVAIMEQRGSILIFTTVHVFVRQDSGYRIDEILDVMVG
jgi:hypothetical protein